MSLDLKEYKLHLSEINFSKEYIKNEIDHIRRNQRENKEKKIDMEVFDV